MVNNIETLTKARDRARNRHGATSKEYRRVNGKLMRARNPEAFAAILKRYRDKPTTKERERKYTLGRYHTDPEYRARCRAANKAWRTQNPEKMAAAQRNRRINPQGVVVDRIHNKLRSALFNFIEAQSRPPIRVGFPGARGRRPMEFYPELGCSIREWSEHLQSQFKEGMTWDNHGRTGWHIDHVIPKHKFRLPEEANQCFHYTNTRPRWAKDNQERVGNL